MDESLFQFIVPFNNQSILKGEKKLGRCLGVLTLFLGILLTLICAYLVSIQENQWVVFVFAVISLIFVLSAVICFRKGKVNPKNENRFYRYDFFADGLAIAKNSSKNLENYKNEVVCLYRPYSENKYIAKIYETNEELIFKIRIGSYNYIAPIYKKYYLPKSVLGNNEAIISKLKEIIGKDYIVKNK